MPHKNAVAQLKSYGDLAIKLDELTHEIDKTWASPKNWKDKLPELLDLSVDPNFQPLIKKLCHDPYAYNRELAAISMRYLWSAWKIIKYDASQPKAYKNAVKAYIDGLSWTFPLLHTLLDDKRSGPAELAILAVDDMEEASLVEKRKYRNHLLQIGITPYQEVRFLIVKNLVSLYPISASGHHTLDQAALDYMVASTYDKSEKVRDWACFELWLMVENLDEKVEKAFQDAVAREDPDSNVFMEAVTGLARLRPDRKIISIICDNFKRDDVGNGWINTVVESQHITALEAMLAAYNRLLQTEGDESMIRQIEYALEDWNT